MKKVLTLLFLVLVLFSCGKEEGVIEKENKTSLERTIDFKNKDISREVKRLDKKGQTLLIEFAKAQKNEDQEGMDNARLKIREHMKTIQDGINNIKGINKEENNKEMIKIISKIAIYTKIGF